jgi:hypothetical protein
MPQMWLPSRYKRAERQNRDQVTLPNHLTRYDAARLGDVSLPIWLIRARSSVAVRWRRLSVCRAETSLGAFCPRDVSTRMRNAKTNQVGTALIESAIIELRFLGYATLRIQLSKLWWNVRGHTEVLGSAIDDPRGVWRRRGTADLTRRFAVQGLRVVRHGLWAKRSGKEFRRLRIQTGCEAGFQAGRQGRDSGPCQPCFKACVRK